MISDTYNSAIMNKKEAFEFLHSKPSVLEATDSFNDIFQLPESEHNIV